MGLEEHKVTQVEIDAVNVKSAPDRLTGTAQENKGVFDRLVELACGRLNSVIDSLVSSSVNSGASKVGATPIAPSGSANIQGILGELNAGKVDKADGKGLSEADYTDAEKTKLAGIADNANNYVLPIASTSVVGGVKAGTNVVISPDGTISAQGIVSPDLEARAQIAQEIADRQTAVNTEATNRATADTNIVNSSIMPWASTITYALNRLCSFNGKIFRSLQNNNMNHATTDTAWWGEIGGGSALTFTNVSVPTASFVADITYPDYPLKAVVTLTGVTAEHFPIVTYGLDDSLSGNFAPVCDSGAGNIAIWAVNAPSVAVSIKSILCVKGV